MADRLVARTGLSKTAARDAADGVFAAIGDALANGEEVRIAGYGTFGTRGRSGSPRAQAEDRRGGYNIGVDVAHIQGRQDAEGGREGGSRVMMLQRHLIAAGSASSSLSMEPARLLYDDEDSANGRDGAGKTEESREVDGWSATGLNAAPRMRQGDGVRIDHRL